MESTIGKKTIEVNAASVEIDEMMKIIKIEHTDPSSVLGMHHVKANGKNVATACIAVRAFRPNAVDIKVLRLHENSLDSSCARNGGGNGKNGDDGSGGSASGKNGDDSGGSGRSGYKMVRISPEGFFEAVITETDEFFRYQLEITWPDGSIERIFDPYSFPPTVGDLDMQLFNEGNHHRIFDRLGAHICSIDGVEGAAFAVWAPCAVRVSVTGDFNFWDGRVHQMRRLGSSGIWEIFIPGISENRLYKYEIKTFKGELYFKSDPYAFYSELRPKTASIVHDMGRYAWGDADWIKTRDSGSFIGKPVSIYEVHLGSWARVPEEGGRFLTYTEFSDRLVRYVKSMGFTHIELMPVSEHPFDGSWGYQITGYYSITSRYGTPEEFMAFVDKCHSEGIGVIADWVPAHFPKDGHGLARFDGTALYEHEDSRRGEHPDWGTHIFNYGRNEVRNFLVSNALFWFEKYHIDGLRVDAVASMLYLDYGKKNGEWLPNKWGGKENLDAVEFMKNLNTTVFRYFPGVMMIAEESTAWALVSKPPYAGGLGFSFKWNMGWMNDFLKYVSLDPIHRKYHHNSLIFSIMYAFSENFILVLSHDEVVHGKYSMINKMPGDEWQKFAGLRASYGYMFGHPGKKLLFMGNEFGQPSEWNFEKSLDWDLLGYKTHRSLQKYVRDLNAMYVSERALYEEDYSGAGFEWINCNDAAHSTVSFIRRSSQPEEILVFVCNFTPVVYLNYRIGVSVRAFYKEIMNSDSAVYDGSNSGNQGGLHSDDIPYHSRPFSLNLTVPPYGVLVFKPQI